MNKPFDINNDIKKGQDIGYKVCPYLLGVHFILLFYCNQLLTIGKMLPAVLANHVRAKTSFVGGCC
jgi:hypothetical protein